MAGRSPMQKLADEGRTPMRDVPGAGTGSSLTVEALAERYGAENAKEVYYRAAFAAGYGNFRNSSYANLPPLDTTGLSAEGRAALAEALAAADKEFVVKPAESEAAEAVAAKE